MSGSVVPFENLQRIVTPKRGIMREESAVSLLAESRFLADKAGFGMTRIGRFLRKLHHYPMSPSIA
jgi:hypothetical protein